MKSLKDWTKSIEDLPTMEVGDLENVYSEMLATAHDLKFAVPDDLLVETQDPAKLREVIPPLHEAIKKFHDEQKNKPVEAKKPKPIKVAAPAKTKTTTKGPKKTAAPADQKEPAQEKTMAKTATAKKAAAPKTAKKAAKGAKKGAAAANARSPVGRSKFTDEQKITVKAKEIPAREGSSVYDRLKNLWSYNGKTVGAFLKSSLGQSSTLATSVRKGWISIK